MVRSSLANPKVTFYCPPKISRTKQFEAAIQEINLKPDSIIRFHDHEDEGPCAGLEAYDQSVQARGGCWEYRPDQWDTNPVGWATGESLREHNIHA